MSEVEEVGSKRSQEVLDSVEPESKRAKVEDSGEAASKKKAKKYALCSGYIGAAYHGFQWQKEFKSIEHELIKALAKSGAIAHDEHSILAKVDWSRAARTDKGVSAAINVVACKMNVEDDTLQKINDALPADVRAFALERVKGYFDPRDFCTHRRYEYVVPSFFFAQKKKPVVVPQPTPPPTVTSTASAAAPSTASEAPTDQSKSTDDQTTEKSTVAPAPSTTDVEAPKTSTPAGIEPSTSSSSTPAQTAPPQTTKPKSSYIFHLDDEARARVNRILQNFIGTHVYHNFTEGIKSTQDQASRQIYAFHLEEPYVVNNMEWVKVVIEGKSFVLHQIRFMIGLTAAVARGVVSEDIFEKVFELDTRIELPLAPSHCLLLDELHYHNYNRDHVTPKLKRLDWQPQREQINAFKQKIYEKIYDQERRGAICADWLFKLDKNGPKYIIAKKIKAMVK